MAALIACTAFCSRWRACQGRRKAPPPSAVFDPWQALQREPPVAMRSRPLSAPPAFIRS